MNYSIVLNYPNIYISDEFCIIVIIFKILLMTEYCYLYRKKIKLNLDLYSAIEWTSQLLEFQYMKFYIHERFNWQLWYAIVRNIPEHFYIASTYVITCLNI